MLSDGRPNDVVLNRPNVKNPAVYTGEYAVKDTAAEVRRLRSQGISVLGVFAGEEQDLSAERRIFGKDFAYIRTLSVSYTHLGTGRCLFDQICLRDGKEHSQSNSGSSKIAHRAQLAGKCERTSEYL